MWLSAIEERWWEVRYTAWNPVRPTIGLSLMREHEELEVETDRAGEPTLPFWSETVRQVVVW